MSYQIRSEGIVVFYPEGKLVQVPYGTNLLEAAHQAGIIIDSTCGGKGVCGKCKVRMRHGEVESQPTVHLTVREVKQGYVLACQTIIQGDVVVEVPVRSQLTGYRILTGEMESKEVLSRFSCYPLSPLVRRLSLALPPPSLVDNVSDFQRVEREIKKLTRVSRVAVELSDLASLARIVRDNNWQITVLVGDENGTGKLLSIGPVDSAEVYGLAIDIGTSTVVVNLVDLKKGEIRDLGTSYNEQIKFGEDVISRIIYSGENENGLQTLQQTIVDTLNRLILDLMRTNSINPENVHAVTCAGNTVMIHFLLGLDPGSIRREPYIPLVTQFPLVKPSDLKIAMSKKGIIHCLPAVSSYVGGDVVADILAAGFYEDEGNFLLIDMGTNGEIVLGNKDWLVSCSCSVGPAFEGSGIRFGMSATPGAIERVKINLENDTVEVSTIGGGKPRGICGSGLVDALAALWEAGIIDRGGRMNLELPTSRIHQGEEGPEFVLVWGEEAGREDDIVLTEADIGNLIRSKAAVYAGATVLVKSTGLEFKDLDRIYIAGAFGNYLDIKRAIYIGLLPDIDEKKFKFIGNGAIIGAILCLLYHEAREKAKEIARRTTYFELSVNNTFMEEFVSALFLPHTNLALFPSTQGKIKI